MSVELVLPQSMAQFEGRWRLQRRIEDAARGEMSMEGEAVLARSGHRLVYSETGELMIPGQRPLTATQRYIWQERSDWVAIRFSDGRPFHGFPLGVARAEAVHLCDPDRYQVSYDFSVWPDWSSEWRVTGPRKDYVMRSSYRC
jgi:hypothetical protein